MGSNPPESYICRHEWYTGIHCLGAEHRCLKIKTGTVPNFLEKEKSLILEIRKGQWNILFAIKGGELVIFSSVALDFCFMNRTPPSYGVCKPALPRKKHFPIPSQVFPKSEPFFHRTQLDQQHNPDRKRSIDWETVNEG